MSHCALLYLSVFFQVLMGKNKFALRMVGDTRSVEADRLAVGVAQLYAGGVDIELAGCQLPHTHSPNLA